MLPLRAGGGVKNLVPVLDDPPKMLPGAVRLLLSEEPGGDDIATVVDVRGLGLVPEILPLGRGEGVKILVLLRGGPPKIPADEF